MLSKILPALHAEPINWYWFGAMWVTVITSAWAVFFSHAQQYRQHGTSRLVSDLLVREQLGFLSFCFALLISAYVQADQKFLAPWFLVLGTTAVSFYAFGYWLTTPAHVEEAFQRDKHDCPKDPTHPCTRRPGPRVVWRIVVMPALLFLATLVYASLLTFSVEEKPPNPPVQSQGAQTPIGVGIASIILGDAAYKGAPTFIQDNLGKLDQERRPTKSLARCCSWHPRV